MAMKLGGEYVASRISIKHFETFAEEISLSKEGIKKRVIELTESTVRALEQMNIRNTVEKEIAELIKKRCTYLLTSSAMAK